MAVPRIDGDFNDFMNTSNNYLNAMTGGVLNFQRLGLTNAEHNQWVNYTTVLWPPLWTKVTDPNQRTSTAIGEKDALKKTITDFMNILLFRMASVPGVTATDKEVLLLPKLVRTKTTRPAITTAPDTSLLVMEGARVQVGNRTDDDGSRDSMHPDADALQMVYKIGGPAPSTPELCPGTFMSSKAKFIFEGGMENDGRKLYVYTRWVNIATPSKSGPWSSLEMSTISAGTPEVVEVV